MDQFVNERKVNIFIAEDDAGYRRLVEFAFKKSKFPCELFFFEDGKELVDHLELAASDGKSNADVILMDLNMPVSDGRDALKRIRQNSLLEDIPIVIFTGSEKYEDFLDMYGLGIKAYFPKPASFVELIDVASAIGSIGLKLNPESHMKDRLFS